MVLGLIEEEELEQGLEHILTAEKMYSVIFTVTKKKFCLSLDYNGVNSVKGTEIHKANDSEIVATPLCLGKLSKDWSVDNLKKKQDETIVYDSSVDSDAIVVDDVLYIHKYLMKKNNMI